MATFKCMDLKICVTILQLCIRPVRELKVPKPEANSFERAVKSQKTVVQNSLPLARHNLGRVCLARNSYSLPSSANEAFSLKRRLNAIIYEAIFRPHLVLPPPFLSRCTICFPSTAKTAANACTRYRTRTTCAIAQTTLSTFKNRTNEEECYVMLCDPKFGS